MFEPENSLEALMQAAGRDPAIIPRFYRALLEAEIYVLTPEARIEPEDADGAAHAARSLFSPSTIAAKDGRESIAVLKARMRGWRSGSIGKPR